MTSRWPANVILSPEMAEVLDEQSGVLKSPKTYTRSAGVKPGLYEGHIGRKAEGSEQAGFGDSGGASRFFLTAGYEPWELEWIIANGLTPCGT